MRGRTSCLVVVFVTALLSFVCAASVADTITQLPECAKNCYESKANLLCESQPTRSCLCETDDFHNEAVECLHGACSFPDAFAALRAYDEICERPRRDRRLDAWPYISIHIMCVACAIVRIYTKLFVIKKFSPEDWLAITCFVVYIVYFAIGHHTLMLAFGQDIWWIDSGDLVHALKLFWVEIPIYSLLMGVTKISIIVFYIRLCHLYTSFVRICWACVALIALNTLIFIFLPIFQCKPMNWNWDRYNGSPVQPDCLNINAIQWSMNITNIVFDVVVLVLPIPLVLNMKSTLRRKVAIILMFSLGIVVLVASCLKMRFNILYGHSTNVTWDYMDLMVWAGIEASVSVAAPCLPTVRLFLHKKCPGVFGKWFAFGSQAERTLDEYIKAEESEVAEWSADVETLDTAQVVRPRRVVVVEKHTHIYQGEADGKKSKRKGPTEASRILRSLDEASERSL